MIPSLKIEGYTNLDKMHTFVTNILQIKKLHKFDAPHNYKFVNPSVQPATYRVHVLSTSMLLTVLKPEPFYFTYLDAATDA
jgi:hypothetical protein